MQNIKLETSLKPGVFKKVETCTCMKNHIIMFK